MIELLDEIANLSGKVSEDLINSVEELCKGNCLIERTRIKNLFSTIFQNLTMIENLARCEADNQTHKREMEYLEANNGRI